MTHTETWPIQRHDPYRDMTHTETWLIQRHDSYRDMTHTETWLIQRLDWYRDMSDMLPKRSRWRRTCLCMSHVSIGVMSLDKSLLPKRSRWRRTCCSSCLYMSHVSHDMSHVSIWYVTEALKVKAHMLLVQRPYIHTWSLRLYPACVMYMSMSHPMTMRRDSSETWRIPETWLIRDMTHTRDMTHIETWLMCHTHTVHHTLCVTVYRIQRHDS